MITTYINSNYRITYEGVSMVENALGNPNLVQISVTSGCTIVVPGTDDNKKFGIDYLPNGEARSWKLNGLNTRINKKEAHFIFARLGRNEESALLIFSINDYRIDGSVVSGETEVIPASDSFFYIKVGSITATDAVGESATVDREITYDGGYYRTDSYNGKTSDLFTVVYDTDLDQIHHLIPKYPFKHLHVFDYVRIGDAWLKYDPESKSLYVEGENEDPVGFWTKGFISSKGLNPGTGDGIGGDGSATALYQLNDVAKNESGTNVLGAAPGKVLTYGEDGKWYAADAVGLDETALASYLTSNNYAKKSDIPSLSGYATENWVNAQLNNKVDNVVGMGLSHNDFTDALLAKLNGIAEGANNYILPVAKAAVLGGVMVGSTLTASATGVLNLPEVMTAGTYAKVTTDAYGRVTGGFSLSASDIPTLSVSKITGLQDALDKKIDKSDFATEFDKAMQRWFVRDTANKGLHPADYDSEAVGLYSDSYISSKGVNPGTGGGTEGASSLGELNNVGSWADTIPTADRIMVQRKGATHWESLNLSDIGLNETQLGDYLTTNNYAKKSDIPSLSGYATEKWVLDKGYITSAALTDYATQSWVNTQLGGYATSSALKAVSDKLDDFLTGTDTDNVINKWKELEAFLAGFQETDTLAGALTLKADKAIAISAGTGLSGGGDLSANRTLSLNTASATALGGIKVGNRLSIDANGVLSATYTYTLPTASATVLGGVKVGTTLNMAASGVLDIKATGTAGTYFKVTTDAYGRVTSGSNPTTLAGFGITDGVNAVTVNGAGNAVTSYSLSRHTLTLVKGTTFLTKAAFDDLFEKVNIGTSEQPMYAIRAKYGFYTDGFISSKGLNPGTGGSGGGSDYDRLDAWSDYTADKAGYVLSAGLGNDLNTRLKAVEVNGAVKVTTLGSGNVVTAVSQSGNVITFTKGITALTAHQSLANYMRFEDHQNYVAARFNNISLSKKASEKYIELWDNISSTGSTASGWWNLMAGKFIKSGGTASQFLMANGSVKALSDITSAYVTALGTSGNYLTWTKNGVTNNITVPYASNADKLDGVEGDIYFKGIGRDSGTINLNTYRARVFRELRTGEQTTENCPLSGYLGFLNLWDAGNVAKMQLVGNPSALYYRFQQSASVEITNPWKRFAFVDSNVASATKLATARTINGTKFDGTANITTANWGTARAIGIVNSDGTGTAVTTSVNGSASVNLKLPATIKAALTGNANTATALQTARTINGTSFNGSANIVTSYWGTARNIKIGKVTKSVNGSANVEFTRNDMKVAAGAEVAYIGTPTANGWYRIASTESGIGNSQTIFSITAGANGYHTNIILYVGTSYGVAAGTSLNIIGCSGYVNALILKVRIVYTTSYSNNYAHLEIQLSQALSTSFTVKRVLGGNWNLAASMTAGSIPSGYLTKEITPYSGGMTNTGNVHSMGYLKSTLNGNTIQIGSQNTSWAHFQSSLPFYFSTRINVNGHLYPHTNNSFTCGGASNRWSNVYATAGNFSNYIDIGSIRLTYDRTNNAIKVSKTDGTAAGLYTEGFLSSKGLNAGSGTGGGGTDYDRLDAWSDYAASKAGWVLSAGLGNDLNTRLKAVEVNGAVKVSTTGSGNAVTAVGQAGNVITFTKGVTFSLSSHTHSYLPLAGGAMTGNISYKGSKATYPMIAFKDNTADTYGNGIVIGGGGLTAIGGGESAATMAATVASGGNEVLMLCNDSNIDFYTNCQSGAGSAIHTYINGETFSGISSRANKLTTARTITLTGSVTGSVSFDGSANVSLATTTNHTHTFASLTGKPTTLAGYGITDAVTISTAQTITGKKTFSTGIIAKQNNDFIVNTNEFNFVPSGYSADVYFNYRTAGGTNGAIGKYVFSDGKTGYAGIYASRIMKHGGTVSQFLMADGSVATKKTLGAVDSSGWVNAATDDLKVPTMSFITFWNGRYNASSSNLQYCDRGRFGDIVTQSLSGLDSRYVNASGDTMTGKLTISHASVESMIVNSTGVETYIRVQNAGTSKSSFGWHSNASYGTYMYSSASAKFLGIKDNGTPHFHGNTLVHAANYTSIVTKLGTATIGSTAKPIYLNAGTPTALSATVGASNRPVYLNAGTITAASVSDAYLSWANTSISGTVTPIDCAASSVHSANRLAFAKPAGIVIEKSTNSGSTWVDYGATNAEKVSFVSGIGLNLYLGGVSNRMSTAYQLRITLNATNMGIYTRAIKLLINASTNGVGGLQVKVEKAMKGSETTFATVGTYGLSGWSGWNSIPLGGGFGSSSAQTGNIAVYRFTFFYTSGTSTTTNAIVSDFYLIGDTYWLYNSSMGKYGHLYSYNSSQEATFPAKVTATSFSGPLSGNATTATSLQTARTLWGKRFNGTANVSGNMTGVGTITFSSGQQIYCPKGEFNINGSNSGTLTRWVSMVGGSVGIGTSSPSQKLEVKGNVKATGYFYSDGWFQNNVANKGLYNSAGDARWYWNGIGWYSDKLIIVGGRVVIDTAGRVRPAGTNTRRAGMYGVYDSTRIGHIWSIGLAYQIADDGANFGNLYGLAYKYASNTTGGTMAGGHQAVWCVNGTPKVAMGDNLWTSGSTTTSKIIVSSTEAVKHLAFSRANFNYITAPASGTIAFVVNGQSVGSATSELIIQKGSIFPGTTNATSLGTSTYRWSNTYTRLLNVASTATLSGAVSVGGTLTLSSGLSAQYSGSSWISMATRTNVIYGNQNTSQSSAHALYRVKSYGGHAVAFGGLGNYIGFYGFYKSRIDAGTNGTDWSTTWDTTTGNVTHNKALILSTTGEVLKLTGTATKKIWLTGNTDYNWGQIEGLYTPVSNLGHNVLMNIAVGLGGLQLSSTNGTLMIIGQSEILARGVLHNTTGMYSDGYVSSKGLNTSDARLKTDIKSFNATSIIKSLRPVSFKWNNLARKNNKVFDTDEVQYGLIAQEVKTVAPWAAVDNMFKDGYMGVRYEKFIPVIMKAQIETIDEVEGLKRRLSAVERENEKLRKEIQMLKAA